MLNIALVASLFLANPGGWGQWGLIESGAGVTWPLTDDSSPTASSGQIRLGNNKLICWRDSGDTADQCIRIDTSDDFSVDGDIYTSGYISIDGGQRIELNGVGGNNYLTNASGTFRLGVGAGFALTTNGSTTQLFGSIFLNTFASAAAPIDVYTRRPDATPNDGDVIHNIYIQGYDDAPTAHQTFAQIVVTQEDVSDGTEDASYDLKVYSNGSLDSFIKADGNADAVVLGAKHEYVGEMYQRDNSTATTVSVAGTWYEVDNFSSGDLYGWTHSTGDLTVTNAGSYLCHHSTSYEVVGDTQSTETSLSVNDVIQDKCIAKQRFGTGTNVDDAGSHCSLTLAASDVIKLEVRNETSTGNITVEHSNVLCLQR